MTRAKLESEAEAATDMPTVRLANGLLVGNFSSPHNFTFDDGTVLPACSDERAKLGELLAEEKVVSRKGSWVDISIKFKLSDTTRVAIAAADESDCDIVIVPRVVLEALQADGCCIAATNFRTVRLADRVRKIAFSNKFCI